MLASMTMLRELFSGKTTFAERDGDAQATMVKVAPKLVAMGELEQAACDELIVDLERIRAGEGFLQCPPVYEFVATKR